MIAKNTREVFWTVGASNRHDETAWDIALRYGEQAAISYIEGIDHSVKIIQENPQIGKVLSKYPINRHRHITSRGWEIVYFDDETHNRVVIVDIRRGSM